MCFFCAGGGAGCSQRPPFLSESSACSVFAGEECGIVTATCGPSTAAISISLVPDDDAESAVWSGKGTTSLIMASLRGGAVDSCFYENFLSKRKRLFKNYFKNKQSDAFELNTHTFFFLTC